MNAMNTNILKFVFAAGAAVCSFSMAAQNLDPTVVVDRTYEGKLLEVHKPALEMAVPDTVKQFDLDFDYSVFTNPYKGSYEFKPYQLLLKPVSADVERSSFWLKAGAGYSLYPELEAVWTPFQKGPFKMNVYADYGAYFGQYRDVRGYMSDDMKTCVFDNRKNEADGKRDFWKGYRMRSQAGVDGRYDWKKSAFDFDLGYFGIASKDKLKNRSYNAVDVNLGMASKPHHKNNFHYDLDLDYRFGKDYLPYSDGEKALNEHVFSFGAVMGSLNPSASSVLVDVDFDCVGYGGNFANTVGEIALTPHYILEKKRWFIDLGLKLDLMFPQEETGFYQQKGQIVYPDVEIKYAMVRDALMMYLKAEGGNHINTYSSILERNPFMGLEYMVSGKPFYLDTTVERVNAKLGLDGRISRRFSYDIYAGYANYASALLDAVGYMPGYAFASYQKVYAGIDWNWHAESVDFDGKLEYEYAIEDEETPSYYLPAEFTGDVSFMYNWNRRVFAGVDCMFSTARKGYISSELMAVIPGYADLGVNAEYAVNRKFSVWLRGGNLLNMTIQHTPLYAEKGISFTAGIRLNL